MNSICDGSKKNIFTYGEKWFKSGHHMLVKDDFNMYLYRAKSIS